MNKIPNNLREYRLKAGLTQIDVARALGFKSTDRISRWEAGLTYPHVKNLFKMGKIYKTSVENFYTNSNITSQDTDA